MKTVMVKVKKSEVLIKKNIQVKSIKLSFILFLLICQDGFYVQERYFQIFIQEHYFPRYYIINVTRNRHFSDIIFNISNIQVFFSKTVVLMPSFIPLEKNLLLF